MSTKIIKETVKKESEFEKRIKNYFSLVEKRNKRFLKLSRPKRIVEICKDSIFNLIMGNYLGYSGDYCSIEGSMPDVVDEKINETIHNRDLSTKKEQCKPLLPYMQCNVCQKGAILLSTISFRNKFTLLDIENSHGDDENMLEDFTQHELDILEMVFENWGVESKNEYVEHVEYGYLYSEKYFSKKPDETIKLMQIAACLIHYKGNVYKAMSLNNMEQIKYSAIFKLIAQEYVIPKTVLSEKLSCFNKSVNKKPKQTKNIKEEIKNIPAVSKLIVAD